MAREMLKDERTAERGVRTWLSSGLAHQIISVGAVMLYGGTLGASLGYSAVLLPQLQSNTSSIPTDAETGSWIASLQSGVSPLGTVFGGIAMDRWGRRFTMIAGVIPLFVGYMTIAFSQSHLLVLIGRFITGTSAGFAAAASVVFLCEISTPRLRGIYSSSTFTSFSVGILLVYSLGSYLHWQTVAGLLAVLPLTSLIGFYFARETPVWLAKKGLVEEAENSLTWLRGDEYQATLELQELLAGMRAQLQAEEVRRDGTDEELVARRSNMMHQIQFLLSPSILKPFFIGHIFNLFQIFTGTLLVIFYAVDMISETQDNTTGLDSFTIAQLTGFVRLVFTLIANWLLYWVPRRRHAMAASSVCACAALSLSCFLFVQLKTRHSLSPGTHTWLTPTLILVFIAANTCAFLPLPSTIMSEILPAKIRGVASGYIYAVNDVMQFFVSKIYPWLKETLGMHGVFLMFGVNALLCCIFSYLFLPETQGQSLPQIEEYFRNNTLFWIKRDKRSDRCNTTPVYIEMKSIDTTGNVKTYSEQDENKHTEYTRKASRKVSVTFNDITEQHFIV